MAGLWAAAYAVPGRAHSPIGTHMKPKSTAVAVRGTAGHDSSSARCGSHVPRIALPSGSSRAEKPRRTVDQTRRMRALKLLGVCAATLIMISGSFWSGSLMQAVLVALGQSLVMLAVIGRLWCTLYIGGRKNGALVTHGPYSMSRNPLYVCSILGAAGIGLLFGSIVIALLLGGATGCVFWRMARIEAAFLRDRFGVLYDDYSARVPLLWPSPSSFEEAGAPQFLPGALIGAARDGLIFLTAIPAAQLVWYFKEAGLLPEIIPVF